MMGLSIRLFFLFLIAELLAFSLGKTSRIDIIEIGSDFSFHHTLTPKTSKYGYGAETKL